MKQSVYIGCGIRYTGTGSRFVVRALMPFSKYRSNSQSILLGSSGKRIQYSFQFAKMYDDRKSGFAYN